MASWKLAPALCAGNVVVIKSAEQTPLSLLHLASLIVEAGFPPGVVNVLNGFGPTAGAAMVVHKDVDKIAFTGSTEVGRIIQREAAGTLKNVTLELGGKSPLIVAADADVAAAAEAAAFGIFFNAGQVCCAASRVFVHESIHDDFVARVAAKAKARTLGDAFSGAEQGPQVDVASVEKIERLVKAGVDEGARLVCGGQRVAGPGNFYQPTVFADGACLVSRAPLARRAPPAAPRNCDPLTNPKPPKPNRTPHRDPNPAVADEHTICTEEIFGPVLVVQKFATLEEVIERANASMYGLASAVFTTNLDTATTVGLGLRAGVVWVNCYDVLEASVPFGGYKQSGCGRELGQNGLAQYSEVKTITIKLGATKNS